MKLRSGLAALTLTLACGASQAAVASLYEEFIDITTLIGNGWLMQNNSTPGGLSSWFQGNTGVFDANTGPASSYIAANYLNAPLGGAISNWLITPEIAFSSTQGNFISFALRGNPGPDSFPDRIEVYYSTAAVPSVGGTPASTGNFNLLATYDFPTDPGGWITSDLLLAPQATTGRYAFRYVIGDTNVDGNYVGIDSVRIGVPEPASAALLMLGMAGLAFARRRQRSV